MFRGLINLVLIVSLLCAIGCASTLEGANKGAEEAGKTGGQVMRIPLSASEGVAEGRAGEAESDPYTR